MGSPIRFTKSPGLIIAGLTVLSLGIVGFGTYLMLRAAPTEATSQSDNSTEVAKPVVDRRVTALGRIEPEGGVYNVAPPSGRNGSNSRVLKILVKKGMVVKQGQPLAVMDSYDSLRADAIKAEANVRQVQAQLAQVKAGSKPGDIGAQVADAQAKAAAVEGQRAAVASQSAQAASVEAQVSRLEVEVIKARRDFERYRKLAQEGAIAAAELDSYELALATKLRELEQARRQLQSARSQEAQAQQRLRESEQQLLQSRQKVNSVAQVRPEDIKEAEAQVQVALATLQQAKVELNTAAVTAPIDGQVLEVHAEDGEAVGSKGILDLGQTQLMNVKAEVYETDIGKVRPGQAAIITSPVLASPLSGRVVEVGLQINKKDVLNSDPVADTDARVVEVKIRLEDGKPVAGLTNLQVSVTIDT